MENKIFSVAEIERINKKYEELDERATLTLTIEDNEDFEIRIKPQLSLLEYLQCASDIAESVFYESEENGETETEYTPQYMNIALQRAVLVYYTDMDIEDADPEQLYAFCNRTGILDSIMELVDTVQFNALLSEIDKLIEFKKSKLIYTAPKSPITEMFSALTKNVAERADDPEFYRQVFESAAAENEAKNTTAEAVAPNAG